MSHELDNQWQLKGYGSFLGFLEKEAYFWGKVNVCSGHFFSHVQLLRFVVVKNFLSCFNPNFGHIYLVMWISLVIFPNCFLFLLFFFDWIVFIWSNHVYKINIEEKTNNTINRVIPRRLMSFQLTVQLTLI